MNETRKSIFITGAASGIGRATAVLFAEKGWYVGAVDVNEEGLKSLAVELGADNCFTHVLDVTDRAAYEQVLEKFGLHTSGKLDLLFNNAGIGAFGLFDEVPFEDHLAVIQVNLMGVVNGIYAALPMLKATENSLCFTTSSSAATYGSPGLAIYAATKHAVKGLTEALSVEFSRFNVRAADVLPLIIDTAIWHDSRRYSGGQEVGMDQIKNQFATEGMARLLPASDVAEVVWNAYSSDKLHWYVPDELRRVDKAKGESPEMVRERYKAGSPFSSFDQEE
jgi:NAD(P)-dependent dehydrogenase (short-subunit alcohol dehydrogenase family)